jgi:hypothetical protein
MDSEGRGFSSSNLAKETSLEQFSFDYRLNAEQNSTNEADISKPAEVYNVEEGDWICPLCCKSNYHWSSKCNHCNATRYGSDGASVWGEKERR